MAYADLVGKLTDPPPELDVAAFPDGSVDSYYQVYDGENHLTTRAEFTAAVTDDRGALQLGDRRRFPGGQTVNMALQAAALEDDVSLAGYLDDPIFDSLSFETVSMGAPAEVAVLAFEHEDLMLAARSPEAREWEFAQLRSVVDPEEFLDVDLVCTGNAGVFTDLSETAAEVVTAGGGGVLVFDPGEISGWSADSRRSLVDALATLERGYDTVLSANEQEIDALAAALPSEGAGDDLADHLERIRTRAEITGVVAHMERRAVAATDDGVHTVPNLDTEQVVTVTGAGDRFTAGLGHGLAAGWRWEPALQLGHTCVSYHVVHGETLSRTEIPEYLENLSTVDRGS
jgi:hypothetical protein